MTTIDPARDTPDTTLDLPAVAKHNWKSKEHRDTWDDRLGGFAGAFVRAKEAALLDDEHPRSAIRRTVPTDDALDLASRMPDEIDISRSTGGESTTVALASAECNVDTTELLNGTPDSATSRSIQGAPECCANAYRDAIEDGNTDPIPAIARNSPSTTEQLGELLVEDPYPVLNLSWSYLGWRFIDFYPCSFECDRAREVAAENGRLLRQLGHGDVAEAMFEFLSSPTYWSGYHGLAHVKNGWCIGEYDTDDYWTQEIVRFNGYHEELAGSDSTGC